MQPTLPPLTVDINVWLTAAAATERSIPHQFSQVKVVVEDTSSHSSPHLVSSRLVQQPHYISHLASQSNLLKWLLFNNLLCACLSSIALLNHALWYYLSLSIKIKLSNSYGNLIKLHCATAREWIERWGEDCLKEVY